ncbi:hypothetical protein FH972_023678 [Carpinus fangiana]|uniref:Uncharacterized protein n=1 Tax=Carpinus fangiana TaxID=176857 RepID=A0A5N6KWD6_9ROSI|nr:hypothetical protein FH972_023678 [Carpinus fangiana]
MATRLVSSWLWKQVPRQQLSTNLYEWVYNIIKGYSQPVDDPDIALRIVEFLERIISNESEQLMQLDEGVLETYFLYVLGTLQIHNPLPKAAAAKFWITFMGFKADQSQAKLVALQLSVGPALTKAFLAAWRPVRGSTLL